MHKICGIVDPKERLCSLAWWTDFAGEHEAWMRFFSKYGGGAEAPHVLPLATAILAYKSIGFRAVWFTLEEITEGDKP